jgi:hypothetical protein
MSVIDKLKVADSVERAKGYDPVRLRRKKLAQALQDQLNLLDAAESGEGYRRVRVERRRDQETDELVNVEQQRRVSPWWWVDDSGNINFSIRYGAMRLKVKDGKNVIVFSSTADLRKLLPPLRLEVLAGGLDKALAEAADELQDRFKARKTG